MPLSPDEQLFLIEEFKALRSEIDHHLKALSGLQISAAGGLAAIYVFAKDQGQNFYWIFPAFILLVGVAALPNYFTIKRIGAYLARVEKRFVPDGAWERFLSSGSGTEFKGFLGRTPYANSIAISWAVLFICAFIFAYLKS